MLCNINMKRTHRESIGDMNIIRSSRELLNNRLMLNV